MKLSKAEYRDIRSTIIPKLQVKPQPTGWKATGSPQLNHMRKLKRIIRKTRNEREASEAIGKYLQSNAAIKK